MTTFAGQWGPYPLDMPDAWGRPSTSVAFEVLLTGTTTLATTYADRLKTNPSTIRLLKTDQYGSGKFFADPGTTAYDIRMGGRIVLTGITVPFDEAEEQTAIPAGTFAQALSPTAVKTAPYTAAPKDYVLVDTTAGTVAITLPTAPPDGTRIGIKIVAPSPAVNTATFACGGSDHLNLTTGPTTGTVTLTNQAVILQYASSNAVWTVQSSDLPLSQLDTRFQATISSGTYVDTTTGQTVAGAKTLTGQLSIDAGVRVKRDPYIDAAHTYFAGGVRADGTTDDTAAMAAFASYVGDTAGAGSPANPVTTSRTAQAPARLPGGTIKVTAPILFPSLIGMDLRGAGKQKTFIKGFGTMASVLDLDGVAYSHVGDLTINSDGTADITEALRVHWDPALAARSTTADTFQDIAIQNCRCRTGVRLGQDGLSNQVDSSLWINCQIYAGQAFDSGEATMYQKGIHVGSSIGGNNFLHTFIGCHSLSWAKNLNIQTTGVRWVGGSLGNGGTDVYFQGLPSYTFIEGFRSEGSQRLMDCSAASTATAPIELSRIVFVGNAIHSDGNWIKNLFGGTLKLSQVQAIQCGAVTPVIYLNSGGTAAVCQVDGLSTPTTLAAAFNLVNAANELDILDHVQTNDAGVVSVITRGLLTTTQIGFLKRSDLTTVNRVRRTTGTPEAAVTGIPGDLILSDDGSAYVKQTGSGNTGWAAPRTQRDAYTTAGSSSYTVPPWAKTVEVELQAAGGGGGSGRKGLAGTARVGGGGGGAGGYARARFAATDLTSPVSVTVGAGGAGGASVTGASTNGNNGSNGGATLFGTYLRTNVGIGGGGGQAAAGGAAGSAGTGEISGTAGGAASATGAVGVTSGTTARAGGGGSGGGITTGDAAAAGGAGSSMSSRAGIAAPTAGAVDTNGGDAVAAVTASALSGHGGAGGGASTTTNAGRGGNSVAGGGGGGGGAAVDATGNSGAGGNGGDGWVIVIAIG